MSIHYAPLQPQSTHLLSPIMTTPLPNTQWLTPLNPPPLHTRGLF